MNDTEEEYTVDQLAQAAELPTSTVRMYQNRGLLSAPERRGRKGIYNAAHRSRLALIANLQERGFSLAAIKDVLDSWERGESVHELLALEHLTPSLRQQPLRVPLGEIGSRLQAENLTQTDIQRASSLGLIKIDRGDVVIQNSTFLEVGSTVAKLGVPLSVVLDEYEFLAPTIADIADRFQKVFDTHFWDEFVKRGRPEDELPELAVKVEELAHAANKIVVTLLSQQFADLADKYVSDAQGERLPNQTPTPGISENAT